ncbi:MAG: hypothetical protein ACUVWR_00850 [Anaerolineae bacterium]
MEYKRDWEQAQGRYIAWWQGQVLDRRCLAVTAPRDGMAEERSRASARPPGVSLEKWWLDLDYVLERTATQIRCTYWGGEAFPVFWANLGPDAFAAYLGADLRLVNDETTWAEPNVDDWKRLPPLTINGEGRWWQLQTRLLEMAQEAGRGRWITGLPDTHGSGDALVALRGASRLCLDLYDAPEEVRRRLDEVTLATIEAYCYYYQVVEPDKYGSSAGWLPAWHRGRANAVQCDFIALISPAMMRRFRLPALVAEAKQSDAVVFHLDGPDALVHLDALLETPEITAIQWQPGVAKYPMTDWIPLLRRIQAAGKPIWIGVGPQEVPTLLCELQPEGLMIHTHAASEAEARHLLSLASKR